MSFCSELNEKLDTIIAQLGDLAACCTTGEVIYGNPPDYSLDGTGLVPQAVVDAGYATDTSDWEGYADYKCMAAHILVENLKATVDSFGSLVETAGITVVKVAGVLASAWFAWITGGASIVILGKFIVSDFIIWEALEALGTWAAADLHDLTGDIEDIRDAIVCAAVDADGLYAIKASVDDVLDAELSATAATLVKLVNTQAKINAFFAPVYGNVDVAAWLADYGADVADYDCTCEGTPMATIQGTFYGTLDSHLVDDQVVEFEEIPMTAGSYAGHYACGLYFGNADANGEFPGNMTLRVTAISGWSGATGHHDRYWYYKSGTHPFLGAPAGSDEWSPGTPPFVFLSGNTAGGYIMSDTPFTVTFTVESDSA